MDSVDFSSKSTPEIETTLEILREKSAKEEDEIEKLKRQLARELEAQLEKYSITRVSCVPHWVRWRAESLGGAVAILFCFAWFLFLPCVALLLLKSQTDDSSVEEIYDDRLRFFGIFCAIATGLFILLLPVWIIADRSLSHARREFKAKGEIKA